MSGVMNEAIDIRLKRARSWLRKASGAALAHDFDAQFIFLWIALNALYGTPRYSDKGKLVRTEMDDCRRFLEEVERLSCGALENSLRPLSSDIETIMRSPFLDLECWRKWDKEGIRDRQKRVSSVHAVSYDGLRLNQLFLRIYTLRNQLLHGAATDAGQRNRESLTHAIPILLKVVQVAVELVDKHRMRITGLDLVPFPPSVGEGGRFNVPRLKPRG